MVFLLHRYGLGGKKLGLGAVMGRFPDVKTDGKLLFETSRLRVRQLVVADEASMYSVYGDPIAARWVDDG